MNAKKLHFGKDEFLALLCTFIWGMLVPAIKTTYSWMNIPSGETSSLLLIAGCRFLLAGVIVVSFASIRRGKLILPEKKSDWNGILTVAVVQTVIHYGIYFYGLSNTIGVRSTVLTSTCTFWIIIFAIIAGTEKATFPRIMGCVIGFAGVAYMNLSGTSNAGAVTFKGEGVVLLSAVVFGIANILVKKFTDSMDSIILTGWQMTVGGTALVLVGLISGGKLSPDHIWKYLIILMVSSLTAICYGIWTGLIHRNDASYIGNFKLCEPVFGVIMSAIFLNEAGSVNWIKCVIALILVAAGILISSIKPKEC